MIKSIWNIVFWLFVAVFVFFAISFNFKFIRTGSMKPTLKVGAIVAVNPHVNAEVGDIAMYKMNGGYVVHRIIEKRGNEYIFKGDNAKAPDINPIKQDDVVGPVVMKFNWIAPIFSTIYQLDA